jgi:general secretion pathway protein N
MNSSRAFLLLAGVALLGAIASFNEMMADAQASFLDATGETARGTSPSLQQSAVATHQAVTGKLTDATARERPARVLASPQEDGREGGESPSPRVGARSNAEPPAPAGNPLWALPLEQLSITRERPIFSPSRRPPPPPPTYVAPVAVRQPAKPPEPERPAVSLIGTVIGTDLQIGVFLEKATQNVVRLRLGEEHQGWVLRLVKAREVTLVKDVEQTLVLEPPPGEAPAVRGPTVPPPVPNSIGTIPIVNTADYVDEQPLPARGTQQQRH